MRSQIGRAVLVTVALVGLIMPSSRATAQAPLPTPAAPPPTPPTEGGSAPSYSSAELDRVVSPIALYPDPLVAQVLAAATYPDDIADAARWADDHHYLNGMSLQEAMQSDSLTPDPRRRAHLC